MKVESFNFFFSLPFLLFFFFYFLFTAFIQSIFDSRLFFIKLKKKNRLAVFEHKQDVPDWSALFEALFEGNFPPSIRNEKSLQCSEGKLKADGEVKDADICRPSPLLPPVSPLFLSLSFC